MAVRDYVEESLGRGYDPRPLRTALRCSGGMTSDPDVTSDPKRPLDRGQLRGEELTHAEDASASRMKVRQVGPFIRPKKADQHRLRHAVWKL